MDIISAYREVGSYRAAAAISGTTPKTVRRVVQRHEADGARPVRAVRAKNYDGVVAVVRAKVDSTKGRITAKRLLPAAQAAGYEGSARNLRRLVAAEKGRWREDNPRGRRPAVWLPGENLVIDWGVLDGVHVFCAVLAWSRVRFVRFADNERAETTLALLAECLQELGGVPVKVLADRMGCLKGGVVANKVIPTGDYVSFATHHGFQPDWCEAADPESKGIVENLVGYSKTDLMIPGIPFADLAAANEAAKSWCAEVNARRHSETMAVPAERLVCELTLLRPLPSLRLRLGKVVSRKVDRLSCVRFGSARYSVPTRLIGQTVELRVNDHTLSILDSAGDVMAEHRLLPPGQASVLDAHYGGPRPTPRRAVRPRTEVEKRFCALGPVAEAFITGAAAAGVSKLASELASILDLQQPYGEPALAAALERAVRFGRWHARDVRSILQAGAGAAQPRSAGTPLTLLLPAVPSRSLADYALSEVAG